MNAATSTTTSTDQEKFRSLFVTALAANTASTAMIRFDTMAPRLFALIDELYPNDPTWIGNWLIQLAQCINARPQALRELDASRPAGWLTDPAIIAYSAYADRFAGSLSDVSNKVDYLQSLGIRYLHLLPFLAMRKGDNDGGFAVSDYEMVEPRLGSNQDLIALTEKLRGAGISLCADLVLNHCADDHAWAIAARNGDDSFRNYFYVFADRATPDAYEKSLGQVFPQTAPGNFSFIENLGWVWTTFYPYQWDLNWQNPNVFAAMSLSMLRLANMGVEIFRLDSTAYLWKQLGTSCMNLPQTHRIVQALRAVIDIAAPCVALKAEAIVPMDQLPPYFGAPNYDHQECKLAYHSSLMAACWAGLVMQRADIPANVIARAPTLPNDCAWINYIRCHDDIGWNVLHAEAAGQTGIKEFDLAYVSEYLAGRIIGSPARGAAFQTSSANHVHGTNGMTAALTGIDLAIASRDTTLLAQSTARLLLLYGVILALPGVALIYMGDELAMPNDESYRTDPVRAGEGRWLQRPAMDWSVAATVHQSESVAALTYSTLRKTIAIRHAHMTSQMPLSCTSPAGQHALLLLQRGNLVCLFNFSEKSQPMPLISSRSDRWMDLLTERPFNATAIAGYGQYWLRRIND